MIKSMQMQMSAICLIIGIFSLQYVHPVKATDSESSVSCWNRFCDNRYLRYSSDPNRDVITSSMNCKRPEKECYIEYDGSREILGCRAAETPPPPDIYCISSSSRVCRCAHDYTIRERSDEGVAYCNCSNVDPEELPKTLWQDENKIKDLIVTPIVVIAVLALLVAFAKVCVTLLKVSWNIYSAFQSRKKDQMDAGNEHHFRNTAASEVAEKREENNASINQETTNV